MKIVSQNIHFWSDSKCNYIGTHMIKEFSNAYAQYNILCLQEVLFNATTDTPIGASTFKPFPFNENDERFQMYLIFIFYPELRKIIEVNVRIPREELEKAQTTRARNDIFLKYLHSSVYGMLGCPKSLVASLIRPGTFTKQDEELYKIKQNYNVHVDCVDMVVDINVKNGQYGIYDVQTLQPNMAAATTAQPATAVSLDLNEKEIVIKQRDLFLFVKEPQQAKLIEYQQEVANLYQKKKFMPNQDFSNAMRSIAGQIGIQQLPDSNPLTKNRLMSLSIEKVWTTVENDLFDGLCLKELAIKAGYKYCIFAGTGNPNFGNAILSKYPFCQQEVFKLPPGYDKSDKIPARASAEEVGFWRNAIAVCISPLIYREPTPIIPYEGNDVNYKEIIDYAHRRSKNDFYVTEEYEKDLAELEFSNYGATVKKDNKREMSKREIVECDSYDPSNNLSIIAAKSANPMRVSRSFWVVNTHLDHLYEGRRVRQCRTLLEEMNKLKLLKDNYTILCGDFNSLLQADYSDLQIRMIHRERSRQGIEEPSFDVTKLLFMNYFIETLWNSTQTIRVGEVPATTNYGTRVDYIFINSPLNGTVGSVKVVDVKNSDHKGIVAEINVELLQK